MALKDWKEKKVSKWKTLWYKGDPLWGDWIHVEKTSLIGEWEVGARRIINKQTMNGHFKYYRGKNAKYNSFKLAKSYRIKY